MSNLDQQATRQGRDGILYTRVGPFPLREPEMPSRLEQRPRGDTDQGLQSRALQRNRLQSALQSLQPARVLEPG